MNSLVSAKKIATKFTPERRDKFIELVGKGCTVAAAAAGIGVHPRTAFNWRNDDEEFAAAWEQAEAALYARLEAASLKTIDEDTTMRIFLMKSAWPERHVEHRKVENSGSIAVAHSQVPPDVQNEIDSHRAEIEGE